MHLPWPISITALPFSLSLKGRGGGWAQEVLLEYVVVKFRWTVVHKLIIPQWSDEQQWEGSMLHSGDKTHLKLDPGLRCFCIAILNRWMRWSFGYAHSFNKQIKHTNNHFDFKCTQKKIYKNFYSYYHTKMYTLKFNNTGSSVNACVANYIIWLSFFFTPKKHKVRSTTLRCHT